MALILVHLRRIILLLSVIYLSGACFRRLLNERRHAHLISMSHGIAGWSKPLHFQWWAYIYTCYAYLLLVNYVNMRRLTNLIEFFLT